MWISQPPVLPFECTKVGEGNEDEGSRSTGATVRRTWQDYVNSLDQKSLDLETFS